MQLEDDIVTKPGYFSTMKNFALNQKTDDWILLEFSHLGFIGTQQLVWLEFNLRIIKPYDLLIW